VRIVVVSDSCHGGAITRGLNFHGDVPAPVAGWETAAAQSPRYRAMPRDVMVATYHANRDLCDEIQDTELTSDESKVGATLLAFLGCQDQQLARDGPSNGLFTENLLAVWDRGAWKGGYAAFHEAIRSRMPDEQQPNYKPVGAKNADFEQQAPFTVG
jgi:metacaspase-1